MSILYTFPVGVVVPAQDIDRAIQFYQDVLGLEMIRVNEGGALFRAGQGSTIFVYPRPGGQPAEHTVASWIVDNLENVVDELEARGIRFEQYEMPGLSTDERGIAEVGGERASWFLDSEGNILSVAQLL